MSDCHIVSARVYAPADWPAGHRVLVDRLWPRGVRKAALEGVEWNRVVAPSTGLRQAWHAGELDPRGFALAYCNELAAAPDGWRPLLAGLARGETLVLLTAVRDVAHSHVPVLEQFLRARLAMPGDALTSPVCYAAELDGKRRD